MIEEAIVTRAAAVSGLTALIGSNPMRFHPQLLPQNPAYPSVTFLRVSSPREMAMGADPGIVMSRWQFSAWGLVYKDARDLAEQLRLTFERWRGTVGQIVVLDTLDWDSHDAPPDLVNDVIVRQVVTECRIIYRE